MVVTAPVGSGTSATSGSAGRAPSSRAWSWVSPVPWGAPPSTRTCAYSAALRRASTPASASMYRRASLFSGWKPGSLGSAASARPASRSRASATRGCSGADERRFSHPSTVPAASASDHRRSR